MIVKIDKSLEKDVRKIKDKVVRVSLIEVINAIQDAKKLSDIKNLKKLQGTRNFYRIRIGEYRIGIVIEGDTFELIRMLHRKEIYRYFP